MLNETYIPSNVQFGGRVLAGGYMCVLYESDVPQRRGSLTIPNPPRAGERGVLRFSGSRDGRVWDVNLGDVVIVADSAIGCEFVTVGPIRVAAVDASRATRPHDSIDQPRATDRAAEMPRQASDSPNRR